MANEAVTALVIDDRAAAEGAARVTASLGQMVAASNKAVSATDEVSDATGKLGREMANLDKELDRRLKRIDPLYRAEQDLAAAQSLLGDTYGRSADIVSRAEKVVDAYAARLEKAQQAVLGMNAAQTKALSAYDQLLGALDPAVAAQQRYAVEMQKATAVLADANVSEAEHFRVLQMVNNLYDPATRAVNARIAALQAEEAAVRRQVAAEQALMDQRIAAAREEVRARAAQDSVNRLVAPGLVQTDPMISFGVVRDTQSAALSAGVFAAHFAQQDRLQKEMQETAAAALANAEAYRMLIGQLDPVVGAQQRYVAEAGKAEAILNAVGASENDRVRILGLVAAAYDPVTKATNARVLAINAEMDALKASIDLAREEVAAREAQAAINRQIAPGLVQADPMSSFGVVRDARSAAASADVFTAHFREQEQYFNGLQREMQQTIERERELIASRRQMRSELDPLYAAQVRYEDQQKKITAALKIGAIDDVAATRATVMAERELASTRDKARAGFDPLFAAQLRYRQQLDAITDALEQNIITDQVAAAARKRASDELDLVNSRLNQGADGVKLASHEWANLSHQIQDVVVSLAGGQSPLLVMIQQGPQASMAVGGFSRLLSLMVAPTTLVVAGVLALAAGFALVASRAAQAAAEGRRYDAELRALNPTLQATSQQLRQMSFDIAAERGVGRGDANAALRAIVTNRNIQSVELAQALAGVTQDIAAVTQGDIASWADKLADAFARGSAGVRELDDELRFLSAEQDRSIRMLDLQGRRTDAMALAASALEDRFGGLGKAMKSELARALSDLGRSWDEMVERLSRSELVIGAVNLLSRALRSLADAGSAMMAAGIADEIQQLTRQHVDAISAYQAAETRLADALSAGNVGPGIDILRGNVRRLHSEMIALGDALSRTVAAAAAPLPAPLPTASDPISADAEARLRRAQSSLDDYRRSMALLGVERDAQMAGMEAFYTELAAAGGNAASAEEARLIAVQRVMVQYDAALRDTSIALDLETEAQLRAADAAGLGEAAARQVAAANELAAASARNAGEASLIRAQQAIREAAAVRGLHNQSMRDMEAEIRANDRMAAAILEGNEAVEQAILLEFELQATRQYGITEQEKINEAVIRFGDQRRSQRRLDLSTAISDQEREIALGRHRIALLNMGSAARREELAVIEAIVAMEKEGRDLSDATVQLYIANARALAQMANETERLEAAWSELEGFGMRAFDAMLDGVANGKKGILDLKSTVRSLGAELVQMAMKMALLNPIKNAMFGANLPTLATMGQVLGGGQGGGVGGVSGAGGSGAAGVLSGVVGIGNMLAGGVTGLGNALFGNAGAQILWDGGGATQLAGYNGLFGSGGTLFGSAGLASGVTGALGGVGIGMTTAGLMGALGIGKGNATGGAVGGAIGGAIGSIGGPIGTVVGSILGGALGSLFGASPSDKEGNAIVNLEAGRYIVGGMTGAKYSQENRDAARGLADQVLAIQDAIQTSLGGRITGQIAVGAGSRDGLFATAMNSTARRTFASTDEGAQQLLAYVMEQMTIGIRDQLAPEISAALGRVDFTSIEKAAADIDFIGNFRDSLTALRGDFGLVDQVTQEAAASVKTQVDAVREFRSTTARLFPEAVGEADAALRQYVEGLVGIRDAAPAATEMEDALRALEAQFKAYVPLLQEVGYSAEDAAAALDRGLTRALTALRDDFVSGLEREFNDLSGRGWVNQINDLIGSRLLGLRDATALGVDAALIERNFQAGVSGILAGADLGVDQLQEVITLFGAVPGVADAATKALQDLLTGVGGEAGRIAADLAERMAALTDRGAQDAAIRALERRQRAEFEAAAAAGYGAEMLGRMVEVLGGEMVAAVEDFVREVQRRSDDLQMRLIRAQAADPLMGDAQRAALEAQVREITRAHELADAANDNERAFLRLIHAQEDLNIANQALADSAAAAAKAATDAAQAMERITGIGGSIRQWVDQMRSGGLEAYLSPAEQLQNAQAAFDREIALAAGNDETALRGVTGYAQRLIEAQQRWSGSGGATQEVIAAVLGQLEDLPAVKSFDEQQLDLLRQIAANTNELPAGLAIRIEEEVIRTVSIVQGSAALTDEQRALALLTTGEIHKTIGIIVDSDALTDAQKNLALLTSQSVLKTIDILAGQTSMTGDQVTLALLTTQDVAKTIRILAEDGSLTPTQQSLALLTSQNVLRVIQIAATGSLTAQQIELALLGSGSVQRIVNLSLQDHSLTPQQRELLLGQASAYARTIALTVDAAGMSGPARDLLLGAGATFARVVELSATAAAGLNQQQRDLLLGATGTVSKIVELAATQPQGLTPDQKALLDAEAGTVQRTIAQALTGGTLTADQRLALEAVSGQVQRIIDQKVTVNGVVLQPDVLTASFALALTDIEFRGMALANRYLAAIAWNTARVVGNTGQGLLVTDDPLTPGDQTVYEGRGAAQLNIGGAGQTYGYETWQAVQGVGAIIGGTTNALLDKVRHNTATTAAALGGVPAYATGTDFHPGGPALVHAGEVLLPNAPRGMKVVTAREVDEWMRPPSRPATRSGSGWGTDADLRAIAQKLDDIRRDQMQIAQAQASQRRLESREQVAATNRVVSAIAVSARGPSAA